MSHRQPSGDTNRLSRGAILVTGSSSGIGRACALRLAAEGFLVFAGVRSHEDGKQLLQSMPDRLKPILLDITNDEQIASAVSAVQRALPESGFVSLVNCAGISISGPLECVSPAAFRHQLEVNVVGQLAVTQGFIPLLRLHHGCIVNIGSTSGRISGPFIGPYCASKFALEAITSALRIELSASHIRVCIVEPGVVNTPLWSKTSAAETALMGTLAPAAREIYGPYLSERQDKLVRIQESAISPEKVCEAVVHAVMSKRPRQRYVVGSDAKIRASLIRHLPERLSNWVATRRLARSLD